MSLEQVLLAKPPESWVIDQAIVFDWYDGPRRGVVRVADPPCELTFDLLAERSNPDGLDDRLFRLGELPAGSVSAVLDVIQSLGNPTGVIWVPVWNFANEEQRRRADQGIERILDQRTMTRLVIHSPDMVSILGCWHDERINGQVKDWFSTLSIR